MTRTRRLKITFAYGNPKGHPPNDRSGDVTDRFFCFACGRDHRVGSDIARDHKRYSIEGGHESGGIFSDLREFYLQTKGIAAAFRILGLENVKVHPPRFGRGWPSPVAIPTSSGRSSGRSRCCAAIGRRIHDKPCATFIETRELGFRRKAPRCHAPCKTRSPTCPRRSSAIWHGPIALTGDARRNAHS